MSGSPHTSPDEDSAADAGAASPRRKWVRLALVFTVLVALFVIGHLTGVTEKLTREAIQQTMEEAGALGFLLYLVSFVVGELAHVPGVVFITAAVLAYGKLIGFISAYFGALVAISVAFALVRTIGGQPLGEVKNKTFAKVLDQLEDNPIRSVAILRLIFWVLPALNYALAMSNVRYRDYVVGSALGLLPPVALASLFVDQLLALL